ncbi:MAG: nucleoside deaminase [Sphaerochaetaceae bacterium]|nr:nucleoside deaminase [Sphaerochaetaceae bacterium]MDC7236386.1 nucleoside deaminase [Sphaerochaetaceae bacterium]MDC7243481.1 nucleoside deaminase [Sphaerochaetaceae bacterium]MDC7251068.1 nucleoside deaminase [Sphaerochaetaceae bacterium]
MCKSIMEKAIEQADKTMSQGIGGPFGAAIVDKDNNIYVASNSVLDSHDATAHAEINAIRKASKALNTHDLSGCVLYTTCYPCPMCMSAAIWANIDKIIYGCSAKDAAEIGFRDDFIYTFIQNNCDNENIVELKQQDREKTLALFKKYKEKENIIY